MLGHSALGQEPLGSIPEFAAGAGASAGWYTWRTAAVATAAAALLAAPDYAQPAVPQWAFSRVAPTVNGVIPGQSRPQVVLVRADTVPRTPQQSWPFYAAPTAAQPPQNLLHWARPMLRQPELDQQAQPARQSWPFGTALTAVQPWNWWQIAPPAVWPDTSQFYEYRAHDAWADWRLYWVTATTPVAGTADEYIIRARRRGRR